MLINWGGFRAKNISHLRYPKDFLQVNLYIFVSASVFQDCSTKSLETFQLDTHKSRLSPTIQKLSRAHRRSFRV